MLPPFCLLHTPSFLPRLRSKSAATICFRLHSSLHNPDVRSCVLVLSAVHVVLDTVLNAVLAAVHAVLDAMHALLHAMHA